MKKVCSVLLSLFLLMSLLSVGVAVSAVSSTSTPDSQVMEAYAGDTVQIRFVEENCYGVAGSIQYSNRNLFASVTPGGSTSYGKITDKKFFLSSMDKITIEVVLTVKISEYAKVGDTCVVSFTDCELVENNEDFTGRSGYTKTVTVKVISKTTAPIATTPTSTKKPTTTTPTSTKKPTTTTQNKPIASQSTTAETEVVASTRPVEDTPTSAPTVFKTVTQPTEAVTQPTEVVSTVTTPSASDQTAFHVYAEDDDDANEGGIWNLVLWIAGAIVLALGMAVAVVIFVSRKND